MAEEKKEGVEGEEEEIDMSQFQLLDISNDYSRTTHPSQGDSN